MNVECPDWLIAPHSSSTPLGRALTRVFRLNRDVPPDLVERLKKLPGQAQPQKEGHCATE